LRLHEPVTGDAHRRSNEMGSGNTGNIADYDGVDT